MSEKTTLDRLIHMANQIATNLATEPNPADATARHITRYWDPRMKAMIANYNGDGLSANAKAAVAQFKT